jgi:hypothetical protein
MSLGAKINMKYIVLTLFLISLKSFSGEKVVELKMENYISHGYSENSSKELAKQEACNSAKRELIAYVFGAAFQINQNMVRSLGVLDYSQDISVNTGEIILRAATIETSANNGTTNCSIIYPLQEANIEKERLKSAQNFKTVHFTEIGDPDNIKGGVLEVVTIPEDTDVLIDNVRWGTTPLRLNGKLSNGAHTLRLENTNYKIIEEKIEINNSKTRVDRILKRATGKLKIITDPEGAIIKINEEEVGYSPTREIELLAGQKLKIEVTHPEAETYIQNITLIRDENKIINQKLLLKPGFISLNIVPSKGDDLFSKKDIVIGIDGIVNHTLSANSWIQVEAGEHNVSVSVKEYDKKIFKINVRGGEKLAIPTIELTSLKEIEGKKLAEKKEQEHEQETKTKRNEKPEEEEEERFFRTWHILLGPEGNFNSPEFEEPSYGIFLGGQKSLFNNIIGIQISASFGIEGKEEKFNSGSHLGEPNSTRKNIGKHSYYSMSLSLPVYIESLYLVPALGVRHEKVKNEIVNYDFLGRSQNTYMETMKTTRHYYSFSIGWIYPENIKPGGASIFSEVGVAKYAGLTGIDPRLNFGFRWNFY